MEKKIALMLALFFLGPASVSSTADVITANFKLQQVRFCLKPEFLAETVLGASNGNTVCALVCLTRGRKCRGFRLKKSVNSVCQTMEFDRCDRSLNQEGCSKLERAFVRAQEGLPLGQLCPDGFGNRHLDSTYKMIDIANWDDGLSKCSSEPGELTKYAEGEDRAEVDHFHTLKSPLNGHLARHMRSFFVGGNRSGTFESGIWAWFTCGSAFLPEVWGAGEPNASGAGNADLANKANVWYSHVYGLDDDYFNSFSIKRALCECVDPLL